MPPQKRSIRDFFAPAPKPSQPNHSSTPRSTEPAKSATPTLYTSHTIRVNRTPPTTSPEPRPPSTSQSSANSAGTSKRVVSNGEEVVRNSDSETDSLPELDWGDSSNNLKTTSRATMAKPRERTAQDGLRKPPKKPRDGKSFSLFVQAAQKSAEAERKIAEVKADLDKPLETTPPPDFGISEEALADAVHDDDDPDKAKRLYLAMQRTNALQMDCVFHFFRENLEDSEGSHAKEATFPTDKLPKHRWTTSFAAQPARDQAFLTGFAQQVFRYQQLPEELASWMIDQICIGRSDALNAKYIQLLAAHDDYLKHLLDISRLDNIFRSIGANQQLNSDLPVTPSYVPHPAKRRPLPDSLKSVARLLQAAAPRLLTTRHALYVLFLLCMDNSVAADLDTLHAVQDAIEAIMCNIPEKNPLKPVLEGVVPRLLARITHPILQKNLVWSLPSKSPLTAYFQRHLALAFLLHPMSLDVPLSSPKLTQLIHSYLQDSPDFHITKETDYMSLAARLALLDIAIGPGPGTVPHQPLISPPTSQEGSSQVTPPEPPPSDVKAFNKEVDALAQHIKLLSNSIHESGALSDLTRLDAKDCSERLYHRLENAVRIGGKKVKDPFGDENASEQGKKIFANWLTKSQSGTQTPVLNGGANEVDAEEGGEDLMEN
ncbi:hypothetical protein BU26DRAFT_558798 [Trematosphaeria pertusa]|uniref:Uncharacterized protein n=1 Tax=Trematosphaeria pertusa TaxID=390896 RepID=A0A6A6J4Q0_9PLEO|nr:uncharacterized protein BU26DRAFT_558798 [Trematosphaeria pertusa]KAF2257411.1 hypothetical protein BU26DRAFT_558798 [Trematosphaeria pertusa]